MSLLSGKGGTPNNSDLVSARAQDESHTDAATTWADPKPLLFPTSSSPNPSLPFTPLDADALSVISDLSDESPILEEPSDVTPCDDSVTHVNTNPTAYLASLIEHGISLCQARRSLEEEILKSLETKEKSYLDALESAKSSLAMTRRHTVDIVKHLKVASGDIISIILPWHNEVEKEVYDPEKKPHAPTASPSTLIPATPSAMPPPSLNVQEHQELLQRYEERMHAVKGTGCGLLNQSTVPWPVLIPHSPLKATDSSLGDATLKANLQCFISSYARWKCWSFEETSAIMLSDWVLILGKLKPKKSKQVKNTIDRIINHLRTFSE